MSVVRGCLSLGARIAAGLAAAALVVALPVTMLARNLALVLFEPQALTQAVSDRLIDSGMLRETVVESLMGEGAGQGALSLKAASQYLTSDEREQLIGLLVPQAWIKDSILQLTTQFLAWFDSPSTRLVLTVDTRPVASQLTGGAAARVVEMIVESWPACTLDDVGKMIGAGAMPGEQGFPYCEPPEPLRGVVVGAGTSALQLLGEGLPPSMAIADRAFENTDQVMRAKELVRMVRFLSRWGILASVGLLGMITVLAVRSWRTLARWWGVPLLAGGLLAFVPVLTGGRLLRLFVIRLTEGSAGVPALKELLQAIAEAIGGAVLRPQTWQAALVVLVGAVFLALSLFRRAKPTTSPAPTPVAEAPAPEPLIPPTGPDEPKERPSGMFG